MNPSLVDVAFHGLRIIIIICTYNTCVSSFFFSLSLLSRSFEYPFSSSSSFFSHFTSFFSYLPYMIRFSKFHFCPHSNKAPIRSQFLLFLCVLPFILPFFAIYLHIFISLTIERFKQKLQLQSVSLFRVRTFWQRTAIEIVSELLLELNGFKQYAMRCKMIPNMTKKEEN